MFTAALLKMQVLEILRRVDWQMFTDVSDDRNSFISEILRRTYWYTFADVSEDRNSFIFWDVTPYLLVYGV